MAASGEKLAIFTVNLLHESEALATLLSGAVAALVNFIIAHRYHNAKLPAKVANPRHRELATSRSDNTQLFQSGTGTEWRLNPAAC